MHHTTQEANANRVPSQQLCELLCRCVASAFLSSAGVSADSAAAVRGCIMLGLAQQLCELLRRCVPSTLGLAGGVAASKIKTLPEIREVVLPC